jgi:dipeptidase
MIRRITAAGGVLFLLLTLSVSQGYACTNFLISRGATIDGSTMISYAADSHVLYGELYHWPAKDFPEGTMLDVWEWDTGKYMGKIPQVRHTYNVVGNMNEHQVAIGETTYGGRHELRDTSAIVDYGSLMYIALQRAKTAREAIKVMAELVDKYGYYSSGESFSISDADEVWILEMIGKGPGVTGAVWVARRVPDGYICGHANQARITTFPLEKDPSSISSKDLDKIFDPQITTVYEKDVIKVARKHGWFKGKDKDFSFADAYAPLDFGAARFCEARVWSGFRKVASGMDKYQSYAMGEDLHNRMPLWVKPDKKLSVQDVMEMMRDHYEGTPMDMTQDIGAGPFGCGYRWRPLTWKVDGKTYFNERATSTQQTGFSFVAQSRRNLPDPIGGILWFGVDDTYSTVYTPMYCGITEVPHEFAVGNGDMMTFTDDAAFWVFNQVSNFAYTRYNVIIPEIRLVQHELESRYVSQVKAIDIAASELYAKDTAAARKFITDYSVLQGAHTVKVWKKLYAYLFTKYMDGNIKEKADVPKGYKFHNPKLQQPGYGEAWYKRIVNETGDRYLYKGEEH